MSAEDRIRLDGLALETRIGVHPWERRVRQRLLLDLELPTDARQGALRDDIDAALDYSAVAEQIRMLADRAEVQLVETLAEALAAMLLDAFGLAWVRLTLTKPGAVPDCNGVRLSIERTRGARDRG